MQEKQANYVIKPGDYTRETGGLCNGTWWLTEQEVKITTRDYQKFPLFDVRWERKVCEAGDIPIY